MSTFTRARTRRQHRHPDSGSASHAQDKAEGERRKASAFVPVPAPARPSPPRSFSDHGVAGHAYRRSEAGEWIRCTKREEFADHIEAEAGRRNWFLSQTQRHGQSVAMRRPAGTPIEVCTTTFPPWLSDWTLAEFEAGRDPRPALAKIRNAWLDHATARLDGQRHVLGFAFHGDTDDLHFDLCLSRQDGHGGRIGTTALQLVGPWTVGASRQVRAGATIADDKAKKLRHNVSAFRARHGADAVPLDIDLSRTLDQIAEDTIGQPLRDREAAYAASVPELERGHAAAQLAALDAARARLADTLNPGAPEIPPPAGPSFNL